MNIPYVSLLGRAWINLSFGTGVHVFVSLIHRIRRDISEFVVAGTSGTF